MKTKICPTCGDKFSKNYFYSNRYWQKQKYCSIKCSGTLIKKGQLLSPQTCFKKGSIGRLNKNYRGGRHIASNGYVRILIIGTSSYQSEHRKVMEEYLGRKLKRQEIVHHINGNRQDNRIENLRLIIKNDHDRFETTKRWQENPISFNRR